MRTHDRNPVAAHPHCWTKPPRDLADFHLRWREFRQSAVGVAEKAELTPGEQVVLRWLVELADRVGSRDLA